MTFSSKIKNELLAIPTHIEYDVRSYIREYFIKWGSCSDPEKTYHMEFNLPSEKEVKELRQMLRKFGIKLKRRSPNLLYLKESEKIVDVLNIIGAHKALMAFENVRILKEINNNVNRQVNFETANLGKTVSAAVQQIEDIQYIKTMGAFSAMPEPLHEVAGLRLAQPDATLKEIGQMLNPPISKSGVNHRLRKISAIARALREEKGGLL